MRPVKRGNSPVPDDYTDYTKAQPDLVSRLGQYCSYCERPISTQLAVEHIQPKGLPKYEHLEGRWNNFLLACVNCNSNKSDKDVLFANLLLPDRDNTFAAFNYLQDGTIESSELTIKKKLDAKAQATLELTGLHKAAVYTPDVNGKQVALDRVSQRMNIWLIAEEARTDLDNSRENQLLRKWIIKNAIANGFFSIWMVVFSHDPDMRSRLIDAFPGTRDSECFDQNSNTISPAPNPDQLDHGGKI